MHGIEHNICGKVIVATKQEEIPLLENLYKRGLDNSLNISRIDSDQLAEIEPHVNGLGAIRVPMAGIVNYRKVSEKFADIIRLNGGEIRLNSKVEKLQEESDHVTIETSRGTIKANMVINCAGLHSDRIAVAAGYQTDMKIVPFRGEYYKLKLVMGKRSIHVCNAPSPAATASIEIGKEIVKRIPAQTRLKETAQII